nr:hypothetical protein [uncultured Lichenicoccus sp.]
MQDATYLSTISMAWSIERQEKVLGKFASALTRYCDEINGPARKGRKVAALKERAVLLTPRGRPKPLLVRVAALPCIAFDITDLTSVLAALAEKNGTLLSHYDELELPPNPPAALMAKALAAFSTAKFGSDLPNARKVRAENQRARTLKHIEIVRPFWHLPEPSTQELRRMASLDGKRPMAPATLVLHLGNRREAQARHREQIEFEQREQKRLAAMAAARARKKDQTQ